MDEDTAIINSKTRNEKIKDFFIKNKKLLISFLVIILVLLMGYFAFAEYQDKKKIKISDQYNKTVFEYSSINKENTKSILIDLINKKDSTYSPLALYFIIDNALIIEQSTVNKLFDVIIEDVSLEKEVKNLIIYKKALYNADNSDENELLEILKPILNSESVWKVHGLYFMAEYFYSKNEKQKAKEFFNQIVLLKNANQDLIVESQKRLNRDISE
jgi:predicted negative regulator of RcsB-dependent stress response|tara:strand:+ start:189 stop:833 length:645 start_codon:yes stop_codon:yes gene_type:complete